MAAAPKHPFTGLLGKPINLDDAKPAWLKREFALQRDKDDVKAFALGEYRDRLIAFDQHFSIDSNSTDVWQQRVKAIVARTLGIESKQPWQTVFWHLAPRHVPGFKFKPMAKRKRGQPPKWTYLLLAQLFADVESQRRKFDLSTSRICSKLPSKRGYEDRWKGYSGDVLRKAYEEAKKRRQTLAFEVFLCGPEAVFSLKKFDLVAAAIEKYALKF